MLRVIRWSRSRAAAAALTVCYCFCLAGCGGDADKPKLGKVHGKVTYKGKPVEAGRVVFTPVAGKGGETGQSAEGQINSDGSYDLTTFNTGDGAILGQHTVTVTLNPPGEDQMPKPKADGTIDYKLPKSLGPKKYEKVDSSPLKCTVEAGGTTFDIELKD